MRVLPGVVGGAPCGWVRRLFALAAVLAMAATAAGCSRFDAALGQRQAVVTFTNNATVAQKLAVRTTCAKRPNVTPQPLPSNYTSPYALQQIVYQINQASDADIARLQVCLARYPSVVAGIDLRDSADEGN